MNQFERTLPVSEQQNRVAGLQGRMTEKGIDGALILQKADMFYYTGTAQQGWLYIPAAGHPLLMVFKDFDRARLESGLDRVLPLVSPKQIPEMLADYGYPAPTHLGLEMDVLTANHYLLFTKLFDNARITDLSLEIRLQRAVKSEYEIRLIQKSCEMADKVAAKVPALMQSGIDEIELAGQLEAYARQLGHQGLIRMRMWDNDLFYGHIMCGAGAAVPSSFSSPTGGRGLNASIAQGPAFHPIRPREPVLVDYVFVLDGYISDHTRIFALDGLPEDLLKAHDAMLEIQAAVKQEGRPGAITGDLYEMMVDMARTAGYADCFMGAGQPRIRFAGHGVGLELDEFPFIAKGQSLSLEAGMVIALEPKAVMTGKGVVGIENTLLVTETGLESLTRYQDRITVV